MLKKKSRDIQFFGISLKYSPLRGERAIELEPSLTDYLTKLKELTIGDNKPLYMVDNQKKSFRLQCVEIDEARNSAIFLVTGGDKDIGDPAFWNVVNNTIRPVSPDEGEKISFSCHMALNTQRLPSGNYCLSKEIVPLINHTYIANLLNKISKENLREDIVIDNENIKVYPKITFNEVGSRTLSELLEGKTFKYFEAVSHTRYSGSIDEDFEVKQNIHKLTLKPYSALNINALIHKIKNIVSRTRNDYNEFYIRYTDGKQQKHVSFESDVEVDDIPQMRFSEKKNIGLSAEINQASDTIHQNLAERMIIATREEHSYLSRTHNDSEHEDDAREITASEAD